MMGFEETLINLIKQANIKSKDLESNEHYIMSESTFFRRKNEPGKFTLNELRGLYRIAHFTDEELLSLFKQAK